MYNIKLIIIILFIAIIISCRGNRVISEVEYKIFNIVLDSIRLELDNNYGKYLSDSTIIKKDQIIIEDKTHLDYHGDLKNVLNVLETKMKEMDHETLIDFKNKNKYSSKIENYFKDGNYTLLDSDSLKIWKKADIVGSSPWPKIYEKYKNFCALIMLSRVGLNKEKTQAIVYIGYLKGSLNGIGYYFFLIKKDNNWQIKDSMLAWIS